jgi:hypothetical protein
MQLCLAVRRGVLTCATPEEVVKKQQVMERQCSIVLCKENWYL